MEPTTENQLRVIASGFGKCLALWRDIRGTCHGRAFLEDGIIRDMSESLDDTIRSGEKSVNQAFDIVPRDKWAFECGDHISHEELRRVIENQKVLISNLETIKSQLNAFFAEQQASPRKRSTPNQHLREPESILDIHSLVTMTESLFDIINTTSTALISLVRRIEDKERTHKEKSAPSNLSSKAAQAAYPVLPALPARPRAASITAAHTNTLDRPQTPFRSYEAPRPENPDTPSTSVKKAKRKKPVIPTDISPPTDIANPEMETLKPPFTSTNDVPASPPLQPISVKPGNYCIGAMRLQQNPSLSFHDTIVQDTLHSKLMLPICKHCYLEIDIYPWDTTSMAAHEAECKEVASQHLLMCGSLTDRKAMFRCLVCERQEYAIHAEFRDVKTFLLHRHNH